MPSTDTSDLSVTSVRLLLEMSNTPSLHDTGKSLTFGHTQNVQNFVLSENLIDSDFLFEEFVSEFNLISNGFSSVDLNFEDVVFLLSDVVEEVVLGMSDGSNNGAVLFDSVELDFNSFGIFGRFGLIVREGFLLRVDPVLVESSESSLVQMVGPYGGQSSEASWSLDISDQTDNLQWGSFDDSNSLNFFFLI